MLPVLRRKINVAIMNEVEVTLISDVRRQKTVLRAGDGRFKEKHDLLGGCRGMVLIVQSLLLKTRSAVHEMAYFIKLN